MLQRNSMRFSLRIIILGLFAFLLFNTVNYYLLSTSYYKHLTEENTVYSETVALSISSFLEMAYQVGAEMAQSQEVRSMKVQEQQLFLLNRFSQHGFFENLIIQRAADGLQTVRVRGIPTSRPNRWWFRRLLQEQQPFVSPSFYSFSSDMQVPATVIGLFFPITQDEDDTLVAVMAALLRVDEIQERVGQFYHGDERYTYVLDETGTVIVHPDSQQIKEHYNYKTGQKTLVARDAAGKVLLLNTSEYKLEYQPITLPQGLMQASAQALDGIQGNTEYQDLEGNTILCSYAPVRLPGYAASWAILTVQNKTLALAPLRNAAITHILLSFFIFSGLAALLLRQSRAVDLRTLQLHDSNTALQIEVTERSHAEIKLTAANEELLAINEELLAVTDELHHSNEHMQQEIQIRQTTEGKLRLRELQHRAMVQLFTDNTAALDVQMQTMLDSALQLTDAANGYIAFLEDGRLQTRYIRGSHTPFPGQFLSTTGGLCPLLLATGRLQYTEDYQSFPNRLRDIYWQDISTAIMVPLKPTNDKIIGCLTIIWLHTVHPMEPDALEMLQQYADLSALAFQAAKLKEDLQLELVQRKQLHEQLSRIAFRDALTGLPNRACLLTRLEEEIQLPDASIRSCALFFVDLDDLKSINDNFGHFAGDTVIIAAGEKLVQTMAGSNAFIARLGGDEFIVLVTNYTDVQQLAKIAERLVENLCQDYPLAATNVRISGSIGIASYPHDGTTVEELLKKSDNAMYAAKAAGRNCWRFFDPAMLSDAQEKLRLTNSLRHALENNELSLVYQPQLSLKDDRLIAFEALLRWHSTEHGCVPPGRFIPLAEQSQLIIPIGEWILSQACQFIQTLSKLGYADIRIAVNLSPKQLADDHFVGMVKQLLHTTQILPNQLELEITESALLTALDESCSKLHKLKDLGVSLALDDFGTGYSSLTHLRLFPVKTLKIDKSFIDNIPGKDNTLVDSLIRFAQSLKMNVVAEGVERQEQLDFLRVCGCDLVQGYFFSQPLPTKNAITFLQAHSTRNSCDDHN
ncbi:Phytochrome-like protein cph2 [Sporomusa ovata DSM 2662]|uniref:Diguanylate cyclase/phosphodiesterase (GGDEF & EAL domains) with PAS/PAC sensor(S) n=1 Tax=Sporomusa ovata TaxID=2378 RepID=A0A0U1L1I7_9FIRM|nr:EAL domain-containing protein [Sporomusa ovata]EQB25002.1 diguanylate cyclase/phosphodiesterase [Sporomusa ovata DSM 2662]CQR73546.1 diguanylate cyclase/phosphodiesterase (GGDEF & EAL domains) with PAS/PAC sensor(s) [Sporomusa ovata]